MEKGLYEYLDGCVVGIWMGQGPYRTIEFFCEGNSKYVVFRFYNSNNDYRNPSLASTIRGEEKASPKSKTATSGATLENWKTLLYPTIPPSKEISLPFPLPFSSVMESSTLLS